MEIYPLSTFIDLIWSHIYFLSLPTLLNVSGLPINRTCTPLDLKFSKPLDEVRGDLHFSDPPTFFLFLSISALFDISRYTLLTLTNHALSDVTST